MGVQINGATGNVIATKGTFSGNVGIAGTLTYEDVTDIDAVGLITARSGIEVGASPGVGASISRQGNAIFSGITTIGSKEVGAGITLSPDGDIFATGVTTVSGNVKIGTGVTLSPDGDIFATGVCTATSFAGDGSALTGIGGTDFIHSEQINNSGIVTSTAFVPTNQVFSDRNRLINGKMQICQRGTSGDLGTLGASATNFTTDHWVLYVQNTSARFDVSQVTDQHPDGFGHSLKIDCSTADTSLAATDEVQFLTKVEGYEAVEFAKGTSGAKEYTLSFYVKVNKTGTYIVTLLGRHNTQSTVSAAYTVSDTNWNRYVITFPADTTNGRYDNPDSTEALRVVWWLVAGSGVNNGTLQTTWANSTDTGRATGQVNFADSTSNIFYITGCQLEVGSVATPFEHRKYTRDLHDCYRYYRRWRAGVDGVTTVADQSTFTATTLAKGDAYDADDAAVELDLIPPMNHKPEVETFNALRLAQGQNLVDNGTTVQDNYSSFARLRLHIDNEGSVNTSYEQRLVMKTTAGDFAIEAEI